MEDINIQYIKEDMNIVIVGHVDHGKSTIIGRMLADTNSLPLGKLEQVKEKCKRNARPFEYAFLLDSLKDEQDQGITIDSARCFFKTAKRNYIIIDAPGHVEFLKNMVTGASRAEAALLVIDAQEGIQENLRRHGYLLSMLGIKQICVVINKMDLIDYDKSKFNEIVLQYKSFLEKINIKPSMFIPVSGFYGENIVNKSNKMLWYKGKTVLEALEEFRSERLPLDKPFRMPVQDVYKFTKEGDDRRIIAGTIEAGKISVGDEVVFYPSGKKSKVKSIEAFNEKKHFSATAGIASGFTLTEQIYIKKGELASKIDQTKPKVSTKIQVNLFWLGKEAMQKGKEYYIKLGTAKVICRLDEILKIIDASTLDRSDASIIQRHAVAECILKLDKSIAFDEINDIAQTSRFVIVDNYEISGGGIVVHALQDEHSDIREKVAIRNYKWEYSSINPEQRAEMYSQRSTLILITGDRDSGKKPLAKALERELFKKGKIVYFLGIGNVAYTLTVNGIMTNSRYEENINRMAEIANVMLDAGVILIVTAIGLTQGDLEIIKTIISNDRIEVIFVGDKLNTNINCDIHIKDINSLESDTNKIISILQEKGIIFKP